MGNGQGLTLNCVAPLVSAWLCLLEDGLEQHTDMQVPAVEVVGLIQRTICLIGNASEYVLQVRRAKILEAVHPDWTKYAQGKFPNAVKTLFGDDFQATLSARVEGDNVLAKALSITCKSKDSGGRQISSHFKKGNYKSRPFFRGQRKPLVQPRLSVAERPGLIHLPAGLSPQAVPPSLPQASVPSSQDHEQQTVASPQTLTDLGLNPNLVSRYTEHPVGGHVAFFIQNWAQISQDPWVLDTIQGYRLDLVKSPPVQRFHQPQLDSLKSVIISEEIQKLQQKQAIACIKDDRRGFISPIFVVPKADGSWRPVINLKALNTYVARSHFKMESVKTVKGLLQRGDWLVKLDLKDAYLTIPIHRAYRKYLRFRWQGHL